MRLAIFLIALPFAAAAVGAETPAVLQPPSPSAGEQSQPEQAQPAKTNETAAPDQQRSGAGSIVVNVLPAPKTEAEVDEDRRERKDKAELDRRLVNLTSDLALFTGGLFLVTFVLAVATAALVYATRQLVIGAERTAKRQLRAYLSDKPTGLKIWPGADAAVTIFTFLNENHGQTPARNLRHIVVVSVCPHPLPDDFRLPEAHDVNIRSTTPVFPRQQFPSETSDFSITAEKLASIFRDEGQRIYLFGITRYNDIYGDSHETGICVSCGGSLFKNVFEKARREMEISGEGRAESVFDYSHRYNYER